MAKSHLSDLALFGGRQAFERPIHVNRPNTGDRHVFQSKLDAIWDAKWFTNDGPVVQDLQQRLQRYLGVKNCILTSSGTSAMAILVRALGLRGEVILPSFTFISTAHVLTLAGIRPVFCDIEPRTLNMCPRRCEAMITAETSAIIPTHVWGTACQIDEMEALSKSAGVPLVFDSAHAFGSSYDGRPIGGFGTAEVFSFHATKVFHTFEGGAVTTNDDVLAARLRKLRNFGFGDDGEVDMIGTNAKMSEIHAAMGLTNLEEIDRTIECCTAVYDVYREELAELPGMEFVEKRPGEASNHQYVPLLIVPERFGLTRDLLVDILSAENILARKYFYPGCHAAAPYSQSHPDAKRDLPVTLDIGDRVLVLPAGAGLSEGEAQRVCSLLRFVADHAAEIGRRAAETAKKVAGQSA